MNGQQLKLRLSPGASLAGTAATSYACPTGSGFMKRAPLLGVRAAALHNAQMNSVSIACDLTLPRRAEGRRASRFGPKPLPPRQTVGSESLPIVPDGHWDLTAKTTCENSDDRSRALTSLT